MLSVGTKARAYNLSQPTLSVVTKSPCDQKNESISLVFQSKKVFV